MGAGKPSKKKFCEIFFPSKDLSQIFAKFLALLSAFSRFLRNFAIYLCSPEDVLPVHLGPQTNSTLHTSQRMLGQKFEPVSQSKNEIMRDMSSQPPSQPPSHPAGGSKLTVRLNLTKNYGHGTGKNLAHFIEKSNVFFRPQFEQKITFSNIFSSSMFS